MTEAKIARAVSRDVRWLLADVTVRGLVVRIEPSSSKTYFARSRIGRGRDARWAEIRIGEPGQISLADARDRARKLLTDMRAGVDPRTPQPGGTSVDEVIRRYDERLKQREVVKRRDVIRSLTSNLTYLKKLPVGQLTRANLVSVIDNIEADGRPGAADDFRKHVVAMLNWSVGAGLLQASPMSGYRRERSTRAQRLERAKSVFKNDAEIASFWAASSQVSNPMFAAFLRFLLLTGQRRTETSCLRWSDLHLDVDQGKWAIPANVRKMGDAHEVPLGKLSVEILNQLPKHSSDLVFPGRGGVHMSGWSKRLAPVRSALDMRDFAFHALRRTYRTGMGELGVPFEIAELMIGHARPDLVRRYDRGTLWRQRVRAQEQWEGYIEGLIR
ncbi:tyrosine-type recombinase/integrase [Roseovarius sp. S1116L3]|uniref:tyrosine-type recombinase/integrase n=1 Tax=Roseovarius roseus TaxID=3342636 RepID=UPI00372747F6